MSGNQPDKKGDLRAEQRAKSAEILKETMKLALQNAILLQGKLGSIDSYMLCVPTDGAQDICDQLQKQFNCGCAAKHIRPWNATAYESEAWSIIELSAFQGEPISDAIRNKLIPFSIFRKLGPDQVLNTDTAEDLLSEMITDKSLEK